MQEERRFSGDSIYREGEGVRLVRRAGAGERRLTLRQYLASGYGTRRSGLPEGVMDVGGVVGPSATITEPTITSRYQAFISLNLHSS